MRGPKPPKKPLPLGGLSPKGQEGSGEGETPRLSTQLAANVELLRQKLGGSDDIIFRHLDVTGGTVVAVAVFTDGLIKREAVEGDILKPVMLELAMVEQKNGCLETGEILSCLERRAITIGEERKATRIDEIVLAVLSGDAVFLVEGADYALILNTRGWPSRALQEPVTETVIRGPRAGFNETLRTNTALLRRNIRDPNFKIQQFRTGRRSQTDCALAFIEGIVRPEVVEEVRKRLATIDIDEILSTGELEQLIEDSPISPFPQIQYSERPDKAVAAILQGRVAILVDGTPFAIMVPAVFGHFFTSPEDYYERWIVGSVLRALRIVGSYVATFLPAIYVSLNSFHPGLWPTPLALSMAANRQGLPFPAVVEALFMELTFELLLEAGSRLPQPIGRTIGIVGGIIIGDAAVRSRLVSPAMVVIVALTAVASFAIPAYNLAITFRLLRFPLIIASGVLGLFGIVLGFIMINIHMVCLKSFGVVYLSPFAPYRRNDWKDSLIRAPIRLLTNRPTMLRPLDEVRQINRKRGGW